MAQARATTWPAGVPMPAEQCDGTWRVPLWTPEKGWEFCHHHPDQCRAVMVTRAGCGDRECIAIHQDDLTRKQLASIRLHNPAALLSRRVSARAA